MKTSRPLGLLGVGPVTSSFVATLPSLRAELGPVAGKAHRTASRLVNKLRAGTAVGDASGLGLASCILISVPESEVAWAIETLSAAISSFSGRPVLLCGSRTSSQKMQVLAEQGAGVGSLTEAPGAEGNLFLAEGHAKAREESRRLLPSRVRVLEIEPHHKATFFAGATVALSLLPAVLEAAYRCLIEAGTAPPQARAIIDNLSRENLRAFNDPRRRSWSGTVAVHDTELFQEELAALRAINPLLAEFYVRNARLAVALFDNDSQWLEQAIRSSGAPSAGAER